MLTCIACSKQLKRREEGCVEKGRNIKQGEEKSDSLELENPTTKHAIKFLTSQIKDIALKASGAYRNCKPCSGSSNNNHSRKCAESDTASDSAGFQWYRRPGSSNSTPKMKGLEGGLASGEGTPSSLSGQTDSVMFMEEDEPKEWVAQVETGVLITFVSLPGGGNDLRRIRFSREMYSKWQAQKWWSENYEKVMELYNVRQFDNQTVPLSNPSRSGNERSRLESAKECPVTPLGKEHLRDIRHLTGMDYCSSDSLDHRPIPSHQCHNSTALASTPKLSSISGAKTETSSLDGSERTSSSREAYHSGELSVSNASVIETEWVEQDEPGVYITIRALADGTRELRRIKFSRERFGEVQASIWWEENRTRIQEQYL